MNLLKTIICLFLLTSYHMFAQWSKISFPDFSVMDISNDTIIASTYKHALLYRTTDNGDSWNQLNTVDLWTTIIRNVIIKDNNYLIGSNGQGLYISHDFGKTWKISPIKIAYTTLLAEFDGKVYLNQDIGLYRSMDYGDTWQFFFYSDDTITTGFSDIYCFDNSLFVNANVKIKYKPNQSHNDGKGIYFSSDKGHTWEKKCDGNAYSFARLDDKLYFISGDYDTCSINSIDITGENCQKIYNFHDTIIRKIITCENNIYVGTDRYGLLFSSDSGKSWKAVTDSSINLYASYDIFLNNKYLFIGPGNYDLGNSGLFRAKMKDCEIDFSIDVAEQYEVENVIIYPNPVSDFLYCPNNTSNLRIKIYSTIGICISDFDPCEKVDVSGLAPGMYFVRIGDKVSKFIKL